MSQTDISGNKRHIEIFKKLVEIYVETGEAVGSRSLSKVLPVPLSPATIRNVMSDLEELGILCSDHSSAGRKPTEKGWRFFVNTLVETSDISVIEKEVLSNVAKNPTGESVESILERTSTLLSELSHCVSLIMVPTINSLVKYIDFVLLSPGRAIVVIVNENGVVENRLIEVPVDVSSSELNQATRYINSKLAGSTLDDVRIQIQNEVDLQKEGIDKLTREIVANGLGFVINEGNSGNVIIKGHSNLVDKSNEISELQDLLRKFDEKKTLKSILDRSLDANGIQVFIGAETEMFEMSGCSMIVSPYQNTKKNMVGAIGVLGPSRMRYSRVITLVDYTAKLLGSIV
ncbi:MAG: heat-inducible transcriptional repressor HrcA [Holosporales bacterium]|jgi:heat-inducible transcriptional repressor|nr:heat-inducible transcriptional repressor HrcA [Holosporales bacterium]